MAILLKTAKHCSMISLCREKEAATMKQPKETEEAVKKFFMAVKDYFLNTVKINS